MHSEAVRDDRINLLDVWHLFVQYKYSIVLITLLAAVVSGCIAWIIKPVFRSEVVVSEVQDDALAAAGGLGGSLKEIGGLASLAGVNIGGNRGKAGQRLAVLQSRALVEEFIKRNDMLPLLFPKGGEHTTLWFGVKRFRDKFLNIKEDAHTGLVTVAVEWTDPKVAARWANAFVALANEMIRLHDAHASERNIQFLNQQIQKTNVVELQRVMYSLLESETKSLMMASTRDDYAFEAVDPAVSPELKAKPSRALIVVGGAFFGLILGMSIAAVRRALGRRESHDVAPDHAGATSVGSGA